MVVAQINPTRVKLPRRSFRKTRASLKKFIPWRSRRKCPHNINTLPSEVLQRIFSYIAPKELFFNVRPVCKHFREVAMSSQLWRHIDVGNDISTNVIKQWIRSAKLLRHFGARFRNDANILAEEISKSCKQLESITLHNCAGTPSSAILHSAHLCNLVTRCPRLHSFNFSQSRFMSCKFFRLISKDARHGGIMRRCNYTGPMTPKQMKALFISMKEFEINESATIGNVNLSHRLLLKDIVQNIQNQENPNQMIEDVWENINYGEIQNVEEVDAPAQHDFGMDIDV